MKICSIAKNESIIYITGYTCFTYDGEIDITGGYHYGKTLG